MSIQKKRLAQIVAFMVTALASAAAFAQEAGEAAAKAGTSNTNDVKMFGFIAAGIAIGLGVLGGATGQGKAAAAALEGIARNPGAQAKIQTPMILGLALIESLVLFALVVALKCAGVF